MALVFRGTSGRKGRLPVTTESDAAVQAASNEGQHDKPRTRGWRDPTVIVAVFALIVSAVTGAYAYGQVKVAREQATASEQQQLVTLVISIAQLNEASGSVTSPLSVSIGNRSIELVDGQAAVILINELPRSDVSTTDYVQVGKALADGGDFQTAISYFGKVRYSPQDPDSYANAMRNDAIVWYEIADNKYIIPRAQLADLTTAHQHMMRAARAYAGLPLVELSDEVESVAFTYLDDASWQVLFTGHCQMAGSDVVAALRALLRDPAEGRNTQIAPLLAEDVASVKKCSG
jgi:hypothetical protein